MENIVVGSKVAYMGSKPTLLARRGVVVGDPRTEDFPDHVLVKFGSRVVLALVAFLAVACDMPGTSVDGFCLRSEVRTPEAVYASTVITDRGFFRASVYLTDASPVLSVDIPLCAPSARMLVIVKNNEPGDPAELSFAGGAPMRSGAHEFEATGEVFELRLLTPGAIFSGTITISVLR